MGGDDPAIAPHRLQDVGEFLSRGIAFRKIHDAQRHAGSTGGHGVLNNGTGGIQFLFCIWLIGKTLHADLHRAGAHHGGGVQRQLGSLQPGQILPVGLGAGEVDGAHHRLFKGIVGSGVLVVFGTGGHADAAVAGHSGGNALGQLHNSELRVVQGLRVMVTMDVHKAGGHGFSGGVDDNVRGFRQAIGDGRHLSVGEQNVCPAAGIAQTVVYGSVFDQDGFHREPPNKK